jgi:hypothetical protein
VIRRFAWTLAVVLAALAAIGTLDGRQANSAYLSPVGCAQEPAFTGNVTTSAGGCATTVVTVPAGGTVSDAIFTQTAVSTSELDKTSDTTLATVTGLSLALTAGKTYLCRAVLFISGIATTNGIKLAYTASGGLTATSVVFAIPNQATGTVVSTALGTAVTQTPSTSAGVYPVTALEGTIVVNAGGTVLVQGAQATSSSTTLKFLVNSSLKCTRIN